MHTLKKLEKEGFEITLLDVGEKGIVSPAQVEKAIRPDTALVTVMYANNEIGTIQPISEIGAVCRQNGVLFHTDAVQAAGHLPINVEEDQVDMLSLSAHKFNGPKGIGVLYAKTGVFLTNLIEGGGQERGKRAGTENIAGIVGMGKAAEIAAKNMRTGMYRETMLRNYLIEKIMHEIPDVRVNGHRTKRLPGNVSVSFRGGDGASLLILLDEDGICASGGSACNTGESRISYVIKELGVPEDYAAGTVRMTLCRDTRRADIDAAVESLKRNIERLRD
mgnify:CR=1 FL=1